MIFERTIIHVCLRTYIHIYIHIYMYIYIYMVSLRDLPFYLALVKLLCWLLVTVLGRGGALNLPRFRLNRSD